MSNNNVSGKGRNLWRLLLSKQISVTASVSLEVSTKFNGRNGEDKNKKNDYGPVKFDEWKSKNTVPRIDVDSNYSDEENGQYYWELHKKYNEYVKDWNTRIFGPDPNAEEQREIESEAWANTSAGVDASAWK